MKFLKYSLVVTVINVLFFVVAASAQPQNPAGDPDVVPLGGLEYLLLAGGALGGYKIFKKRRQEPPEGDHQ